MPGENAQGRDAARPGADHRAASHAYPVHGARSGPEDSLIARRIAEIPVVADVRESWTRWNDPAARLERRRRRTSRAFTRWVALTLLCGLATAFAVFAAWEAAAVFLAMAGIIVFGTLGVRAGLRLRSLKQVPQPSAGTRTALPDVGSVAYGPMQRLRRAESSLAELLDQLSAADGNAGGGMPSSSVEDVRATADDAAGALRGLAARIEAIERARSAAPESERAALDAAVGTVSEQIEDGVQGFGSLVAAAGQAVAASGSGGEHSREDLADATDRLAGLAIALRELG